MKYYDDWEEAAQYSRTKRAVTTVLVMHKGKEIKAEIIKPVGKDGILNFWHTSIPIRKATAAEIDGARRWKPL